MSDLELVEETETRVPLERLSESAALELIRSRRFEVKFASPLNPNHHLVRAKGWVGHFPLSSGGVVRVSPKVPIANVLAMLDLAYGLKGVHFGNASIGADGLNDVAGRLASIFAKRVLARCVRGLFGCYVERHEDLPYVRGRMNPVSLVAASVQGRVALDCRYEEFTQDVPDNQILFWTLHIILKAELPEFARSVVRSAFRALQHQVSLVPTSRRDLLNRSYSSLNKDYELLHSLCRFFLDNLSPGLRDGARTSIPFAIHMPGLFEKFVAQWLKERLPANLVLTEQWRDELPGDFAVTVKPDLVISNRQTLQPLLIIDTKYKHSDTPSQDDLFQVVAYATHLSVNHAFLLYPIPSKPRVTTFGGVAVRTAAFDLGATLAQSGNDCLAAILSTLKK